MKTSIAITLIIGIIITPIIATILFGISIFNEIKITSIISIPIFCTILLLHILIIYITYRKFNRSMEFSCRISAPYYDFFLLFLQISFIIFGILLAIVNMQNSDGKCSAFVSSSPPSPEEKDDDDSDGIDYLNFQPSSSPPPPPPAVSDDMNSGSASCGGITIVFLITCIILCLKLFTLPFLKNLTALTKQIRSSTMHPLTADPRIRINAFSMHETFNAPTSLATSTIPSRFPSATFSTFNQIHPSSLNTPQIHRSQANSNANLANGNAEQQQQQQFEGHQYVFFLSIPPPPSYQESIQALPPSYENISNLP